MGGGGECGDCMGQPPPHFGLPPPPRPPYLHDMADCAQPQFLDMKTCSAIPIIDAEYHSSPAIPSWGLIVVCSLILLAVFLIVVTLLWKHKKKIQNFSPCKSSPQNRCDVPHGNNIIYEDLTNICPRQISQPPVSVNELKHQSMDVPYHLSLFACSPHQASNGFTTPDPYNPIYEELSYGSQDREGSESEAQVPLSDDDFAEDELSINERLEKCGKRSNTSSLQGSTGNDLCRDVDVPEMIDRNRYLPHNGREFTFPKEYSKKYSRKRDVPRSERSSVRGGSKQDFSEDILLDAFFQYHTDRVRSPYTLPVSNGHFDPPSNYPSRQEFTTFRPSQDSDSGYSHNTFGGRGSSRGRSEYHLPYSLDFILS